MRFRTRFFLSQRAGHYRQRVSAKLRFLRIQNGIQPVELQLPTGPRMLGSINVAGRTFKTSRKKEHILREGRSIAINEGLLNSGKFDWIVVDVQGSDSKFVTSVDFIRTFGQKICYGKAGYEVQVFLPLSYWGLEKARQFARSKKSQLTLFSRDKP
jgi:hypothetical protein